MTDAAESEDKRGDRDRDGRFLAGHRLGGRPPGIDVRRLVAERAATDPSIGSAEDLVWGVVVTLARRAALGDVQAAKLLLAYLAADPRSDGAAGLGLDAVIGETLMSDEQRAARIAEILRDAAARRELDRQRPRTIVSVVTAVPPADSHPPAATGPSLTATGAVRGAGPSPKDSA